MEKVQSITVRPALHRGSSTALTEQDVRSMWQAGRDFIIAAVIPITPTGLYINQHDYEKYARGAEIRCRYNKDQDVVILEERKEN